MTKFTVLSVAAVLSAAIGTRAMAQEAVAEPGLQAFYQSLGVGSHDSVKTDAMASARGGLYMSVPIKRVPAKHSAAAHRM